MQNTGVIGFLALASDSWLSVNRPQTISVIFILLSYLVLNPNPWQSLNMLVASSTRAHVSDRTGYSDFGLDSGSTND